MKKLMISLDKKILDKDSHVAQRMIEYGKEDELFIIIPSNQKIHLKLSPNVHVHATGGNKITQFIRTVRIGIKLSKEKKIEKVTTQDPFFTGLAGLKIKRVTGVALEVQLHGDFFSSDYYKKNYPLRYKLALYIINQADSLRVVGERIYKSLLELDIKKEKISIQPILIDKEKILKHKVQVDLHKKYSGYNKIFLVLGRLEKVKNIMFVVSIFEQEILKNNKDILLLIVGNGSQEKKLKEEVEITHTTENIKFESWTNDPISYLKTSDCLLFPSFSEGYGLVPVEASVAGCKVIMNDVGLANYELPTSALVNIIPIENHKKWIGEIKKI